MPGYPRPLTAPPTPLSQVAALLGVPEPDHVPTTPPVAVTGVTHASGDVRPGDLYAGLPGARHHGAAFAQAAARAGAIALLTDASGAAVAAPSGLPTLVVDDPRAALGGVAHQVYGEPTRRLRVIGITGTAGKTSTVYLIAAGLAAAGRTPGVIGTVETRMGDLVIDSARTTPEAPDLHALLAVGLERGVDTVAMEVSSHALALGRVGGVHFAVGGFTNLGVDHLDFHADLEDYFVAKARLFDGRCDVEIVNVEGEAGHRLLSPRSQRYTGPDAGVAADWYATDVAAEGYRQRFVLHGPGGLAVPGGVGLPGRHNVANAVLAVATLVTVGVEPAIAAAAVAVCAGAPGRMERVPDPGGVLGVVDYAHKPDAVAEVLTALRSMAGDGRVICVIGAGGDRDRGKRPLMGAAAAGGADLVIVTDDNPRTEPPAQIRAEVLAGTRDGAAEVVEIAGRREAIVAAVAAARPGDVVALLGKGHERGQEIAGEVFEFDDRVELAAALRAAAGTGAGGHR